MTTLMPALTTSGLNEYIADIAQDKIIIYIHEKYTVEEETKYYASDDYKNHLDYLIATWISYIDYNGPFETISTYFEAGRYTPEFNDEWLDDIFERYILDTTVCLK